MRSRLRLLLIAPLSAALFAISCPGPWGRGAEDPSWSVERYTEMGMPSPGRIWTPRDYQSALEILRRVAAREPSQLPRSGSGASGPMLARIVSGENLAFLSNSGLPVRSRFQAAVSMLEAIRQILSLYLAASEQGLRFDDELIEIQVYMLRLVSGLFQLTDALVASQGGREAMTAESARGLARMRRGLVQMVDGALSGLGPEAGYRRAARLRFARQLVSVLPELFPWLPPETREGIREQVSRLEREAEGELATTLERILEAIR